MRRRHDEAYTIVEPNYSSSYTIDPYGVSYIAPRRPFFSKTELKNIALAVGVLILALTLVLWNRDIVSLPFTVTLAIMAVFLGFFSHEMAHKVLARRYGCWAEFRADIRGLGFALLLSFLGFLFAAPGAVYIMGRVSKEQNGKISIVGPASNLVIALACLPFLDLWGFGLPGVVASIAFSLYFFNTFLAVFNMVPIPPLDGSKIWMWNKPIYIVCMTAAVLMFILAWIA